MPRFQYRLMHHFPGLRIYVSRIAWLARVGEAFVPQRLERVVSSHAVLRRRREHHFDDQLVRACVEDFEHGAVSVPSPATRHVTSEADEKVPGAWFGRKSLRCIVRSPQANTGRKQKRYHGKHTRTHEKT